MVATRHEWYMVCTNDKYSLPIYMEDSIEKISELTGIAMTSLITMYSKVRKGTRKSKKYDIVYLENEGEEYEKVPNN